MTLPALAVARVSPAVVGASRIVIGFLFCCHGVSAIFGVLGRTGPVAFGSWPGFYAAAIQLICGALLAGGAFTRSAGLLGSGSMAYAYFSVHQAHGALPILNGGESAALFCWALLLLAFTGPGALALGPVVRRRVRGAQSRVAAIGPESAVEPLDREAVAA